MPEPTEIDTLTAATYVEATDRFAGKRGSGALRFPGSLFLHKRSDGKFHGDSALVLDLALDQKLVLRGSAAPNIFFQNASPATLAVLAAGSDAFQFINGAVDTVMATIAAAGLTVNGIGVFDRTAGSFLTFARAGTQVGDIGVGSQVIASGGTGDLGITSRAAGVVVLGCNTTPIARVASTGFVAAADNTLTLGGASNRWSVVYAGTGSINTSDERDKRWLGGLTAAHIRAARRIVTEIGLFQWAASFEEKGDDARHHIGVRAQRVWAIMADEGLEAPIVEGERPSAQHAFLAYDEWPEEVEPVMEGWRASPIAGPDGKPVMIRCLDGEEATEWRPTGEARVVRQAGDRFGLRPDQLNLFLVAALAIDA